MTTLTSTARTTWHAMTDAMDQWRARRQHERDRKKRHTGTTGTLGGARKRKVKGKPCRVCSTYQSIEAHHLVPRSKLGRTHPKLHDDDNLLPLCHLHHQMHHTQGREYRIARHHLTAAELTFVLEHTTPAWADAWYPTHPTT